MRAVVVSPAGDVAVRQLEGLSGLQGAVGGYVEAAARGHDWAAYVNEEGLLDGLEQNVIGSALVTVLVLSGRRFDPALVSHLVGPVVFVGSAGEHEVDVPPWLEAKVRRFVEVTSS